MNQSKHTGEAAVQARFACSVCGQQAGAIQLRGPVAQAELRRGSFTGVLSRSVAADAFGRLRAALVAGDADSIFELDPDYVSF